MDWEIRMEIIVSSKCLKKNINILKAIVYDKPYGMARKYNLVHQINNIDNN